MSFRRGLVGRITGAMCLRRLLVGRGMIALSVQFRSGLVGLCRGFVMLGGLGVAFLRRVDSPIVQRYRHAA